MNKEKNLYWTPFYSLLKREIKRFMRVATQTLAFPLVTTVLYLLIFGLGIGRQIREINSVSYLDFIIPGLAMMAVIRNAFDNVSSSIATSKFCGELEDLKIAPLSPTQITWALSFAGMVRGVLVGIVTLVISLIFQNLSSDKTISIHSFPLLFFFLLFGALCFANIGLIVAMVAKNLEQVSAINVFLLLPLIYLSGVFFSLEHLSPFWQGIANFNPVLYLINGLRYSILGFSDVNLTYSVCITVFSMIISHYLAVISLKKGNYQRW
jgi:ABC-2 type transport system permease protein